MRICRIVSDTWLTSLELSQFQNCIEGMAQILLVLNNSNVIYELVVVMLILTMDPRGSIASYAQQTACRMY